MTISGKIVIAITVLFTVICTVGFGKYVQSKSNSSDATKDVQQNATQQPVDNQSLNNVEPAATASSPQQSSTPALTEDKTTKKTSSMKKNQKTTSSVIL